MARSWRTVVVGCVGALVSSVAWGQAPIATWESPDAVGGTQVLFRSGMTFGSNRLFVAAESNQGESIVAGLALANGDVELELRRTNPSSEDPVSFNVGHFGSSLAEDQGLLVAGAPNEWIAGEVRAGAAYLFDAQTGQELRRFVHPDPIESGFFGNGVAIEGNLVVVGAYGNASPGKVYGFDASTGAQLFCIDSLELGSNFGFSVALDNGVLAVGAPRSNVLGEIAAGRVYLFDASTQQLLRDVTHTQPTIVTYFGTSLTLEGGVLTAAVEDWSFGTIDPVLCFDPSTGGLLSSFLPSSAPLGSNFAAVSLSQSSGQVMVGVTTLFGVGSAHVFDANTGVETATLATGAGADDFGTSVALSGNQAASFAPGTNGQAVGLLHFLDVPAEQFLFAVGAEDLALGDDFGGAIAVDGSRALVGARNDDDILFGSGSAYLIDTQSGATLFELLSPNPSINGRFGTVVDLDGSHALVGSFEDNNLGTKAGGAYVFDANTGVLRHELFGSQTVAGDEFAWSLDVSGDLGLIGARKEGNPVVGAAYLFDLVTGAELLRLVPADGAQGDKFGESVAVAGDTLLVGAIKDDDNQPDSGSVYGFDAQTGAQLFKLYQEQPTAGARFGKTLSVDGNLLAVGTDNFLSRRVFAFDWPAQQQLWEVQAKSNQVGIGSALSVDNGRVLVGQVSFSNPQLSGALLYQGLTGELLDIYQRPTGGGILADGLFGSAMALSDNRAHIGSASLSEVLVFDSIPEPFEYCTAKQSSAGCLPAMAFNGTPSIGQPGVFDLIAVDVLNSKTGLLFYGYGQTSLPFMGGTLCAAPPLRRTPPQFSGGTPPQSGQDCTGGFSFDMQDWIQSGVDPFLVPGATIGSQFWFRDPAASFGIGLSDAVGFEVLP